MLFFWSVHFSIAHIPFQKRIILSFLSLRIEQKKYYLISFHFPFNFYSVHDCISFAMCTIFSSYYVSIANSVLSWRIKYICWCGTIAGWFTRCCYIVLPFWCWFFFRNPNFKSKHINAFQLCWCNSLNLWQNKLKIKIFIVVYSPPLATVNVQCTHPFTASNVIQGLDEGKKDKQQQQKKL